MSEEEILSKDIDRALNKIKGPLEELVKDGITTPGISIALLQLAIGLYCTQNPWSSWEEQLKIAFVQTLNDFKESGLREALKEKKKEKG